MTSKIMFKSQLEHVHAQPIRSLAFVARKKLLPTNKQITRPFLGQAFSWAPVDYGLMSSEGQVTQQWCYRC